jgi:outer membrane receptor protein involved in Fe transport
MNYFFRANIENLFDEEYVDSADTPGVVFQGAPRFLTFKAGINY